MPIYDYECRKCGQQFELLLLRSTVAVCPSCRSEELEQLLSRFSVNSESIRQSNITGARHKYASSKNFQDRRVAEAEMEDHD